MERYSCNFLAASFAPFISIYADYNLFFREPSYQPRFSFFLSFFFTPQIVKRSISLAVKKKKIFEERKRSYRTRSLRNLSFSFREKKKEKKKKCEIGTRLVARAQAMTMKSNSYSSVRPKFPSLSPEASYKLAVISKGRSQIRGVLSDWRQVFLGERVNLSKRM